MIAMRRIGLGRLAARWAAATGAGTTRNHRAGLARRALGGPSRAPEDAGEEGATEASSRSRVSGVLLEHIASNLQHDSETLRKRAGNVAVMVDRFREAPEDDPHLFKELLALYSSSVGSGSASNRSKTGASRRLPINLDEVEGRLHVALTEECKAEVEVSSQRTFGKQRRCIAAQMPDGAQVQIWFDAQDVLMVWPHLVALTELVKEQGADIVEELLSQGAAQRGAFYMHGPGGSDGTHRVVGYKLPLSLLRILGEGTGEYLKYEMELSAKDFASLHDRLRGLATSFESPGPSDEPTLAFEGLGGLVPGGGAAVLCAGASPGSAALLCAGASPGKAAAAFRELSGGSDDDIARRWWTATRANLVEPAVREALQQQGRHLRSWCSGTFGPRHEGTLENMRKLGVDYRHFRSHRRVYEMVLRSEGLRVETGIDHDGDGWICLNW